MPPTSDRNELYEARPLSEPPPLRFIELASMASDGKLGLYVGAGISVSTPSLLPDSKEFLALIAPRVKQELGITGRGKKPDGSVSHDAQESLEELADQAESASAGVLAAFQDIAASAADFRGAPPNYGHRAIAALLREGAVTVFTANWDRCIERGAADLGFPIDPTITEADRAVRFASCRLHKVHGCATQPSSLLISTKQLHTPPAWVQHEVGAALGSSTVVFVGLGTVGGYVQTRVAQVMEVVGRDASLWLADLHPSRTWQKLFERAGPDHIIETDSNSFFDDLLRACVCHGFTQLLAEAAACQSWNPSLTSSVEQLRQALLEHDALEFICWLRTGARGISDGSPFLHSKECRQALLALAAVSSSAVIRTRGVRERFVIEAGKVVVELAVWPEEQADRVILRETARTRERHDRNCYDGIAPTVFHICVGHRGPLPRFDLPSDIGGGDVAQKDLVEAELQHRWIPADAVLQGTMSVEVPT